MNENLHLPAVSVDEHSKLKTDHDRFKKALEVIAKDGCESPSQCAQYGLTRCCYPCYAWHILEEDEND